MCVIPELGDGGRGIKSSKSSLARLQVQGQPGVPETSLCLKGGKDWRLWVNLDAESSGERKKRDSIPQ